MIVAVVVIQVAFTGVGMHYQNLYVRFFFEIEAQISLKVFLHVKIQTRSVFNKEVIEARITLAVGSLGNGVLFFSLVDFRVLGINLRAEKCFSL